jgi:hypothetical protein
MAYATIDDLRVRWPGLPDSAHERAAALLDDAAVRIDAYVPPSDSPSGLAVRQVVSLEMVLYLLTNEGTPGGGPQLASQSMGPFSRTFDVPKQGRTLLLTPEQKAMLRPQRQRMGRMPLPLPDGRFLL